MCYFFFFFFKQKTAYEIYQCDWSSDVCSSDLFLVEIRRPVRRDFIAADAPAYRPAAVEWRGLPRPDRKSVV